MATVITAPESIDVKAFARVFLAGAIDMGAAVDWQAQVIEILADVPDIVLMNPRRAAFTPDTLDEQIAWELDALEKADFILMWLPASAKAPVSMFEAGLYLRSGKLLLGVEPGFYRRRNLELTAAYYRVAPFLDDLEMLVSDLRARLWLIKSLQKKPLGTWEGVSPPPDLPGEDGT